MDQLRKHPNDGLDDSPADGVKSRTRIRRRRASSHDDIEPRPAAKFRCTKDLKKATVEAKFGAQAGGRLDAPRHVLLSSPKAEPDTETPPPQPPVFGFGSPQESWQEALESPSPTDSTKFCPHPTDFHLPVEPSLSGIQVDGRSKPTVRRIQLVPADVFPERARNAPKDLMNNPDPWGVGRQNPNASTSTPDETRIGAMDPYADSASKALRPGFTNGEHHVNESNIASMMQVPVNGENHMTGISSGPSTKPLSTSNGLSISPDLPSLSDTNSPRTRIGSIGGLEMAFDGLQATTVTEWQPAGLLCMDNKEPESQYALLVLNQPIQNLNMLRLIWKKAFFRIAADGGANRLSDAFKDPCLNRDFEKIGLEVICGDLDSLFNRVREHALRRGTRIVEDPDQNSTDFAKCIKFLRENVFPRRRWPSNILCLGGLGGRVDQGLSQLHHLYMEQRYSHYNNGRVYLLSTEAITFVLKKGRHRIRVHDPDAPILGKHIGIIPLREPSIITTKGLEWDVTDWPTEFGGQMSTSNHVREDVVEITTTADVLFTIDLNFPAGNHQHPELRRELSPIISMEDDMFFGIETNVILIRLDQGLDGQSLDWERLLRSLQSSLIV